MLRMPRAALLAAGAAGVALLAFGEWQAWSASRRHYPAVTRPGPPGGRDVVLVLGFRSTASGRLNAVQRWRTRIAARSADPATALFVFSGGAVRGERPEAELMADYGMSRLGIPHRNVAIEPLATTTRENVAFAMPWLRDARTIRIASNTHHALRARGYLREIDAGLWERLAPTRDHVLLELGPLRLALTFYDWVAGRAATSAAGTAADRPSSTHRRLARTIGAPTPLRKDTA